MAPKTQIKIILWIVAIILHPWTIQAQQGDAIETERTLRLDPVTRPNTSKITGDPFEGVYAEESPGDNDIGMQRILHRPEQYDPFTFYGDIGIFYSSNVFLNDGKVLSSLDDAFIVGRVGMNYRPKITETLYGEISASHQWFRYDEHQILDFDSTNAGAALTWTIPQLWDISVFGRYNYNRLAYGRDIRAVRVKEGDEFFRNHSFIAGIQKNFPLSRAHYLYLGHTSEITISDPAGSQRNYYSLYTGYGVDLTRSLNAQLYYNLTFVDFEFGGRQDLRQYISGGLKYHIQDWILLSASISMGLNNSNQPINDYEVYSYGGNAGVEFKF